MLSPMLAGHSLGTPRLFGESFVFLKHYTQSDAESEGR